MFAKRYVVHKADDFKPDFTIVGSPTITDDGIVSGFSGSNYITLPKNFNVSGATWEMVFKIRTGNDITSSQSICGHTGSGTADPIELVIKNKKLEVSLSKSGSSYIVAIQSGSEIFTTNTDYFVKMVFDGSAYILSYSTDGQSFIEYLRIANSTQIWTSNLAIGRQTGSSSHFPFLGSIYLKHSYIKINDEYWWTGFYTENEYGTKKYAITRRGIIHKEGDFKRDFNVIGSPNISQVDGKYYKLEDWEQPINPTGLSSNGGWSYYERAFDGDESTYAYCSNTTNYIEWDFGEKICLTSFSGSGNWESGVSHASSVKVYALDDNGNEYEIVGGITVNSTTTYTYSATIDNVVTSKVRFRLHSINGSYSPRVRELKFTGKKAIEATATDYDIFVKNRCFASGFTTDNYLESIKTFPKSVKDLEIVFKLKFGSVISGQHFFNTAPYYSLLLLLENTGKLKFYISNNTTTWDVAGGVGGKTVLSTNTWYYVKFTYDGATYKLYLSTDNKTWNLEASLSSTKTIGVNYKAFRIGHGWNSGPANNTTFDLTESYIKINGEYWWSGFYPEDVIVDKKYILTNNGKYY